VSFLYVVSAAEPERELASAEARALIGSLVREDGRVLVSGKFHSIAESAFVKFAAEHWVSACSAEELVEVAGVMRLKARNFRIETVKAPRRARPEVSATALVSRLAECIEGKPRLDEPEERLVLVITRERLYFGKLVEEQTGSYEAEAQKPGLFSGALPGRLARAMVNIAGFFGERVYDYCCGSGTLVVEALRVGLSARGSDRNWRMVQLARRNLEYFGYPRELVQRADAFEVEAEADVVVSNLPYGRMIPQEEGALEKFVEAALRIAPRAVLVSSTPLQREAERAGGKARTLAKLPQGTFARYFELVERRTT
jgi:predicted RNA methylase